jgi:nucleotidyltransferase substrate binding protein (TIGR01987 family)
MQKVDFVLGDFEKAVVRFEEILQKEKNEVVRDSAIKRFELVVDVSWKAIKAFLEEYRGIVCRSPKGCLQEAFQQKLIEHDEMWNTMVDWRNDAVHTYKESLADDLYAKLPQTLPYFQTLLKSMKQELS